eukprot:scaffold434180_cov40-Prasinocladus_malaysianus.AAC.2
MPTLPDAGSFEPALGDLEERRARAVAAGDSELVSELDTQRDMLLERMWKGLSKMPPCTNCDRRGHDSSQCPRPRRKRSNKSQVE